MIARAEQGFTAVTGRPHRAPFGARAQGAEETLEIIRRLSMLLRPSMLDDLGLSAALGGTPSSSRQHGDSREPPTTMAAPISCPTPKDQLVPDLSGSSHQLRTALRSAVRFLFNWLPKKSGMSCGSRTTAKDSRRFERREAWVDRHRGARGRWRRLDLIQAGRRNRISISIPLRKTSESQGGSADPDSKAHENPIG